MRRALTYAAIALFFLAIAGLIIFKIAYPTAPKQAQTTPANPFQNTSVSTQSVYTDTPYRTAVSCYTWYIQAFATTASLSQIAAEPQATQCFTSQFLSTWQSLAETTGSDPVLQSQDYIATWLSSITAQTTGQSIKTSDQQVTLGSGDNTHTVIAHIVQQDNESWQIDSVTRSEQ